MKITSKRTTLGRLHSNRGYMLIGIVAGVLVACAPQGAIPVWRYDRAEGLVNEGVLALREGRLADAENAFDLARDHAPLAAALDGKGCVAFHRGEFAQAEQLFREAYESDSSYDDALGNLALVLDILGRDEEAIDAYDAFLREHPEALRERNNRAALALDSGEEPQKVEAELAKAALIMNGELVGKNLETIRELRRIAYDEKGN